MNQRITGITYEEPTEATLINSARIGSLNVSNGISTSLLANHIDLNGDLFYIVLGKYIWHKAIS